LNCENYVRRCPKVPGRVCTVVPASGSRSITGNHGQVGIGRSARHRDLLTPRLRSELGPGREGQPTRPSRQQPTPADGATSSRHGGQLSRTKPCAAGRSAAGKSAMSTIT
jgi:hypothetical protein